MYLKILALNTGYINTFLREYLLPIIFYYFFYFRKTKQSFYNNVEHCKNQIYTISTNIFFLK